MSALLALFALLGMVMATTSVTVEEDSAGEGEDTSGGGGDDTTGGGGDVSL